MNSTQNENNLILEKITKFNYFDSISEDDNGKFIKIPIRDYYDLGCLKHNLLQAIDLIMDATDILDTNELKPSNKNVFAVVATLVRIGKQIDLLGEMEGIDVLLETKGL